MIDQLSNQPVPAAYQEPQPTGARAQWFKLKYLLDIAVILIMAAGGLSLYIHHRNQAKPHQLSGLNSYTLAGVMPGRGITFQKPAQLTLDPDPGVTLLPTEVGFNYLTGDYSAAYIAAESFITSPTFQISPGEITSLKVWLNDPNNPTNVPFSSGIVQFASGITAPGTDIHYSVAQAFTNSNIKSNAWRIDIKISNPTNSHTEKGVLVYAIGKNGEYLFGALIHNESWLANQGILNQILNSIKIDQ